MIFIDAKNSQKINCQTKVLKTVEFLSGNSDIYLDKIEQFKEIKKKFTHTVKEEVFEDNFSDARLNHIRSQAQNDCKYPFIPVIKVKPHALIPLSPLISQARSSPEVFFQSLLNPENYEFDHPYETEIKSLAVPTHYQLEQLFSTVLLDKSLSGKFLLVDNEAKLIQAIDEISKNLIVSVDVEFHLIHSFQGFCCLIQMTAGNTDYVFDTLVLFDKMNLLNSVLANPNILKIFHGSDSDVVMLQKDFGLYIVNMIDTFQIAKRMVHNSNSLASLL